ncbi:hypothetical protein PV325_010681 [Microctonus aethiopoides]|nr:hypothetical protein PV325_010681 [Microctonus aethiopoides]
MSLQSTNGNQNNVMIPANDDNFDEEPTSSSASNSDSTKSSKIIISKNSPLKSENEMETESMNDNSKVIETSKSNNKMVKTNERLNNRSINCSKVRIKSLPKRQWGISGGGKLLNQPKNKNGLKLASQKNVKTQPKRIATLVTTNSSIEIKGIGGNTEKIKHKLPELCVSSTDCIACKEKFLDRLELYNHATIAHPDVTIKFCELCDDTFFNETELQNHMLAVHGGSSRFIKDENDLARLNIINQLEGIDECSNENIPNETAQETNQSTAKSNPRMYINIHGEKVSSETLEFMEEASTASESAMENYSHAVQVQIADKDSDIFSYTALDEKKEHSKDFEDCHEINETSMAESEWENSKDKNPDENTQVAILIGNEIHVENRLTSSMEVFQTIDGEVEGMVKIEQGEQIENGNHSCDKNDIQLIYEISPGSNEPANQSIELMESDQHDELLTQVNNDNLAVSPACSSTCRTYSTKTSPQVKKSPLEMNNITEDEINFCIMCREIFSLIEQKSINTTSVIESIFRCPLCSRQFISRSSLEKHVAYYHLNCECTKIVKKPSTLTTVDIETVPESYECSLCSAAFNDYDGLNNHILTLHEPMPPFKDRLTIGKPEYLRTVRCTYMESKLSNKTKNICKKESKVNCPICELSFFTHDDYLSHVKEAHEEMVIIENTSLVSAEDSKICDDSISHTPINIQDLIAMNELKINKSIQHNNSSETTKNPTELRKTCKRCNKEFETVRELSEHFYFSHDDATESQALMTMDSTMDKRTHDWSCLHCSQRFKVLQSYIRHRYFVHNDESMVHVCENCDKILTSITMVNVHVCLNVLSWKCKPCNETFQNGVELRLHNTEKHLESSGPHTCSTCENRFLTATMLMRHREAKKCYPRIRPPEKLNIVQSRINERGTKKNTTTVKKEKSPRKKPKKEYPRIQDLPNMRVIQEDVFVRDAKNKSLGQNKNKKLSSPTSSKSQQNDEIYQCSMCKLYFLSKAGLKIHISRAHISAVEICQLCYKMFVTGNLVRHITDNHLKHDSKDQAYYNALRVKEHNTFQINEHDIERDTEELISTIGITQLLGLCEYQRFTEQSDDNDRFCPDCPLAFDNSEKYRRHYVQTHDKLCALCNMEFETGQDAARHKTRIHGSMACYVWFAHKLVAAISDTKTFSEMAEKIITDSIPIEKNECKMEIEDNEQYQHYIVNDEDINNFSNDKSDECSNNNEWGDNYISREDSLSEDAIALANLNVDTEQSVDTHNDLDDNNDNDDDDEDNYKLFILVTEDDLEKYKNNISKLARQIYSSCNIFSIEQIEAMLEPYTRK